MNHLLVSLVLAGLWLSVGGRAEAKMMEVPLPEKKIEQMQKQELPVYIYAQTLEYRKPQNQYIGSGYVDIRYGDLRLRADEVVLYADTSQARASGNVILDDGDNRLVGEKLEINLKSKLGVLHRGEAFLAPSYFLTGEKIERLAEDKFLITEGSYTACDQTIPDWKLKVKRCLIHLEHYAYMTHLSLYMKKVPVFYFPYALLPIKTQRATGLLIPNLGFSNNDGFIFKESFFWAINDWADATISADYFSKRGIGGGLEFRYALTPEDEGRLQSYLIRDWIEKRDRWKTDIDMRQGLGYGIRGVLKADLLSDRRYNQEFDSDMGGRRRQEQDSYLWLHKNWNHYGASAVTEYTEDLYQIEKNEQWRLPELKIFAASQPLFDSPLYYKLEISGLNWQREEGLKEEEANRLHLQPQLRLPLMLGGRTVITPRASYLQTWYTKNKHRETDQRGLYELGGRLDGPQLYRIYGQKIKHLIQPFIDYNYIPDEDQADLLTFDSLDNIPGENILHYGITQHFLGGGGNIREFLLLTISQEYDVDEARRDKVDGRPRRPFLPLRLDWELKPTPGLRLDWEVRYDVYGDRVVSNNLDLGLDVTKYMSLEAGWRYTNEDVDEDTNFLNAGANFNIGKNIALGVSGKYDAKYEQWVEDRFTLTYTSQCWSIGASYVDRFDEDEFSFSINLAGLSSVGL